MAGFSNLFRPKHKWSLSDVPNLAGRVVVVTGGESAIGKETVKALLMHNAKVYVAAADVQKATEAIIDLPRDVKARAHLLRLDLADLASVKAAAQEFLSKERELHILFNGASVASHGIEHLTTDGYDLHFGSTVLGHFYFTQMLIPVLLAGASRSQDGHARVINLVSGGHSSGSGIDYDTLRDGPKRRKLGPPKLQSQSRFATVVFSNELHRRYGDQGVVSISVNPGSVKSELVIDKSHWAPSAHSSATGALTQLWAGTTPEAVALGGKYIVSGSRVGTPHPEAETPANGRRLWAWLEQQIRDY